MSIIRSTSPRRAVVRNAGQAALQAYDLPVPADDQSKSAPSIPSSARVQNSQRLPEWALAFAAPGQRICDCLNSMTGRGSSLSP
jgi:hypothetical protein